jgi:hypothetical protein
MSVGALLGWVQNAWFLNSKDYAEKFGKERDFKLVVLVDLLENLRLRKRADIDRTDEFQYPKVFLRLQVNRSRLANLNVLQRI